MKYSFSPLNLSCFSYEKVHAKVLRQFQNQGISSEDPQSYSARYGDALLDAKDLLEKVKELGITEDIVCHSIFFDYFSINHRFVLVATAIDRSRFGTTIPIENIAK